MKKMGVFKIFLLTFALLLLSGCGGGGGSNASSGSSNWDAMTWDQDKWG